MTDLLREPEGNRYDLPEILMMEKRENWLGGKPIFLLPCEQGSTEAFLSFESCLQNSYF